MSSVRKHELVKDKVQFIWYDDISFSDILKKSAALPPGTAIFWHLMNVDATGVVYEGDAALRQLYAISSAPIFSYDDGFFGQEIVGGPMHSVLDLSRLTAAVAIRILGGEKPSDVKPAGARIRSSQIRLARNEALGDQREQPASGKPSSVS